MNAQFEGIPTGKFAFFIGVMCLKGSAIGALSALPYAMAADVIDLDSVRTGKKQGGAGSPKRVVFFLQNQGFDPATCVPTGMKESGTLAGGSGTLTPNTSRLSR